MSPQNSPRMIGRYEIVDRLGRGGMGVIYRCRDPRIDRPVAIKLLYGADEELRKRFVQEARSAGKLAHRNIVTVFDYGEHEDQPFLVMEFIEGSTLGEQIRAQVQFSLNRKLELIGELCAGLDYAHNRGIVHRDIKPANIMIARDGVLKILDFGIAHLADSSLTQAGAMMGTPSYMSPEQIEGLPVDRRSDIFAVGLVFYELLSFRQAFARETAHNVMFAIVRDAPTPLSDLCPGLDAAVERIVMRAIEKDPARRYQTLAAMAADVAKARLTASTEGDSPNEATLAGVRPPAPPTHQRTPRSRSDREAIARRRAEMIDGHLAAARQAFDAGDYAAAIEACEQAALIDPDETRVLDSD